MSFLNLEGGSSSDYIVERLAQGRKCLTARSVGFDAVEMNEAIVQAAVVLFREHQQRRREQQSNIASSNNSSCNNVNNDGVTLEKLCINNCPVNPFLEYLIEAAMGMDLFRELELQGNVDEEEEAAEALATVAGIAKHPATVQQQIDQTAVMSEIDEEGISNDSRKKALLALDALGFRMRFSRQLRKLELINLPMTLDHAESLMYGIETNASTGTGCRLETLLLENVRFVGNDENNVQDNGESENGESEDGDSQETHDDKFTIITSPANDGVVVIQELCEGFPNNSTLKTIEFHRCRLNDAQIALIFDSLAYHPSLTSLNLSENYCRKSGLKALDRMLISSTPNNEVDSDIATATHCCRLESLDLSYQFMSEETYDTTGEHIQLDILTHNCRAAGSNKIYPSLRRLNLSGNQINDSDMKDLALMVRYRFPRLEELDLRFNDITAEGLQIFVTHSDPNNGDVASNDHSNSDSISSKQCYIKYHFPPPRGRLRTIRLTNNPLIMTNHTQIVVLKLLKMYPELQLIQSNLKWEDGSVIANYIQHLLDINRAGRVLLQAGSSLSNGGIGSTTSFSVNSHNLSTTDSSSAVLSPLEERRCRQQQQQQQRHPIPLSAWPLVLARLTRKARYPHFIPMKNSFNGMFYLIRHGPIVVEQMVSRMNKTNDSNGNGNNTKRKNRRPKRKRGDPALGGYATLEDFLESL